MAFVREILVDWTLKSGTGGTTVTFWDTETPVATQRTALEAFLDALQSTWANTTTATIATQGREFGEDTGTLVSAWADSTPRGSVGTSVSTQGPDASMVLCRWFTQEIVNGRFINGRTFIPGLTNGNVDGGNLKLTVQTTYEAAQAALVAADAGFSIWHRPGAAGPGSLHSVKNGTTWSEMAVLRKRRGR